MRAADRAYYGVYTPSCPIQPDSLRNRLYGAASWSSRLRADGLITYDGGLGERSINAMEFAHLLEVLAKEMQPVLDTLVKATVADQAEAPNTWRFEIREHARSLREARSHIDLSCAHIRATTECGKAVRFYRKYRQQAEDLVRATPRPGLAQRATDPPASDTRPLICAEAQPSPQADTNRAPNTASGPLQGLPAEGEEVERGLPARTPPRKDEVGFAREVSGGVGSGTRLAAELPRSSRGSTLARTMHGALPQESHAQRTPSEAATPDTEALQDSLTLVCLRSTQAGCEDRGGQLPTSARTRSSWHHECPPHLIRLHPPVLPPLSSAATTAKTKAWAAVAPSAKAGGRLKTCKEFIADPHPRRCPPSSDSTPAHEPVEDARRTARRMDFLRRESKGRSLEEIRQNWTRGGAKTGELGRPRGISVSTLAQMRFAREVSRPPRSSPSPPLTWRDMQAAWARTHLRPSSNLNKLSVDEVSVQKGNSAQHAPWPETFLTARLRLRRLASCGHAPALGLVKSVHDGRRATPGKGTRHAPSPSTRNGSIAGVHSRQRYPPPSGPAPMVELVEDAR
ncbi:hypothetical protein K525DRAFT_150757, partial [Schizophyllum commune Loenen D]